MGGAQSAEGDGQDSGACGLPSFQHVFANRDISGVCLSQGSSHTMNGKDVERSRAFRFEPDDEPFELTPAACMDRNRDSFNPRMLLPLDEGNHEIFIVPERPRDARATQAAAAAPAAEGPRLPARALGLVARPFRILPFVCSSLGSAFQYKELDGGTLRTVLELPRSRLYWPSFAAEDLYHIKSSDDMTRAVVRLLSFEADDGYCYLVFEDMAQQPSLASCLKAPHIARSADEKASRPLTETDVASFAKEILLILKTLHDVRTVAGVLSLETILAVIPDNPPGASADAIFVLGRLRIIALPRIAAARGPKDRHYAQLPQELRYCTAPELHRCDQVTRDRSHFDPAADLWSLGVLVFLLLSGGYPQMSIRQTEASPEEVLKRGQWRFEPKDVWANISDEGKKFLKDGLLQANPRMRASSSEALGHPWITSLAGHKNKPLAHGFRLSTMSDVLRSTSRGSAQTGTGII